MEQSLIPQLKAKQAELTAALHASVDGPTYDRVDAELREVTKALTIAENREKKRQEEEAAAARKAAVDGYNAETKRIQGLIKKADAMDDEIFAKMESLYDAFMEAHDLKTQATIATNNQKLVAAEIGVEPPDSFELKICNIVSGLGGRNEHFLAMVAQYDMAARHLADAKKNKVPGAPTKPGKDWYYKGGAQFYPRDPEPPIPTGQEFFKQSMAERLKSASKSTK